MRHLTTAFDVSGADLEHIFAVSEDLKAKFHKGLREPLLPGRVMALLFEKPSLRTRVSFEAGMIQLGGGTLFLGDDVGFGKRESVGDFCRVLSEFVDVIVARTFSHETIEQLAAHCTAAVVNGLSDLEHPCQAIADLFTMRERFGRLEGLKLAWVGDGNNVARSLAVACGKCGVAFAAACPEGYQLDEPFLAQLRSEVPGADVRQTSDPAVAVAGADVVYTDVWASMGQESEKEKRARDFAGFEVDVEMMARAATGAVFMHCLPAHRGEEVSAEVIDGPQSVVFQQAGNRMHAQKGILAWLLASQS
ncbi:MAG: ornithine carbamoyltransferase [Planctomycetota bacterium]|nr:MAG: ornithine carbamoyltransferase [Planctomycetota bacterium]REJ90279.1 MAG: ornithine carbamoyltransferase [Planctomycetota bacterium]REK17790.1 MAG: ornithine carbamoyltransferase [Planctomycetota bacterium]REK40980.1 MAG: ornithine carbamoyltransferase [Planctomycetota bacterium]